MSDRPMTLERPIRLTAYTFAATFAFAGIIALFIPEFRTWVFIASLAVYCFMLAWLVVGLILTIPSRLALWWLSLVHLPLLFLIGIWLMIKLDPELFLRMPSAVFRGVEGAFVGWLLAGCAIAAWGWVRHSRRLIKAGGESG